MQKMLPDKFIEMGFWTTQLNNDTHWTIDNLTISNYLPNEK